MMTALGWIARLAMLAVVLYALWLLVTGKGGTPPGSCQWYGDCS